MKKHLYLRFCLHQMKMDVGVIGAGVGFDVSEVDEKMGDDEIR